MTNSVVQSNTLEQFRQRFEEIKSSNSERYIKNIRFEALITDMESVYEIPTYGPERIAAFKRAYPEEMKLYSEVCYTRDFGGGENNDLRSNPERVPVTC